MTTTPITNDRLLAELKGLHADHMSAMHEIKNALRLLESRVVALEEAGR